MILSDFSKDSLKYEMKKYIYILYILIDFHLTLNLVNCNCFWQMSSILSDSWKDYLKYILKWKIIIFEYQQVHLQIYLLIIHYNMDFFVSCLGWDWLRLSVLHRRLSGLVSCWINFWNCFRLNENRISRLRSGITQTAQGSKFSK